MWGELTITYDDLPPAERTALLRKEAEMTLEAVTDAKYCTRVGTPEYERTARIQDRAIARLRRRGGVYPPEY